MGTFAPGLSIVWRPYDKLKDTAWDFSITMEALWGQIFQTIRGN